MAMSGKTSGVGVPKGYCAGLEGSEKAIRSVLQAGYAAIPSEPKLQPDTPAPAAPAMRAAPSASGISAQAGLAPPSLYTTMEKGPKAPPETMGEG